MMTAAMPAKRGRRDFRAVTSTALLPEAEANAGVAAEEAAAMLGAEPEAGAGVREAEAEPGWTETGVGPDSGAAGIGVALEALQVGADIGGVLVAQVAVFLERLGDDVLELGWEIGIEADGGHRSAIKDGLENEGRGVAAEGQRARGHLVECGAEGEQVGAAIKFLAPGLLGRHVGDGAESRTGAGEVLLGKGGFLGIEGGGIGER